MDTSDVLGDLVSHFPGSSVQLLEQRLSTLETKFADHANKESLSQEEQHDAVEKLTEELERSKNDLYEARKQASDRQEESEAYMLTLERTFEAETQKLRNELQSVLENNQDLAKKLSMAQKSTSEAEHRVRKEFFDSLHCVESMTTCLSVIQQNKMKLPEESQMLKICQRNRQEQFKTARQLHGILSQLEQEIPDTYAKLSRFVNYENCMPSTEQTSGFIQDFIRAIKFLQSKKRASH